MSTVRWIKHGLMNEINRLCIYVYFNVSRIMKILFEEAKEHLGRVIMHLSGLFAAVKLHIGGLLKENDY